MDCREKVKKFALHSRFVVFVLQLLSNCLIPDHDPGDVFNPPPSSRGKENYMDTVVKAYLGGFQRWDGLYFIHITEHGYIYENSLAFFPLFPWTVKAVANTLFYPLQHCMTYHSVLIVSAFCLNVFLFVQAAQMLYSLGKNIFDDEEIAYNAALLFCINPASIFMTAPYSETLYVFLTFWGLQKFERKSRVLASGVWSLSALSRSNGLLNVGFEIYYSGRNFVKSIYKIFMVKFTDRGAIITALCSQLVITTIPLTFFLCIFYIPFLLYQYHIYDLFCNNNKEKIVLPPSLKTYGRIQKYNILGETTPSWCNNTLPISYSYVQKSHWGVGFLQYYELKQIPNFLLALPVSVMVVCSIVDYYQKNRQTFLTLGLSSEDLGSKKTDDRLEVDYEHRMTARKLLPYVIHLLFLLIFGWMFIHIQVITRLLFSSSPLLYWFAADLNNKRRTTTKVNRYDVMKSTNQRVQIESADNLIHPIKNKLLDQLYNLRNQDLPYRVVLIYFCTYFVIGTVAFSNFLPWT